jgi:hypothetical protein
MFLMSWGYPFHTWAAYDGPGHHGIHVRFGHGYDRHAGYYYGLHHDNHRSYGEYKYLYDPHKRDHGDRLAFGWDLLRQDLSGRALRVFGDVAEAYPLNGEPKVGYAIAAAETGRLSKGVWAMRRALQYDPDALDYVSLDYVLRVIVKDLIGRYKYWNDYGVREIDSYFMVAAFHYLLGEWDASEKAMDRVRYLKDYSVSAKNLRHLIQAR